MPRLPRVHVQERPLMEFTNRVCQGFDLLDLDEDFSAEVIGILAKAQALYPMAVHAGAVMSGHFHLVCSPDDVEQQAGFMGFFTRHLSKAAGRRHGWEGSMFTRRYSAMEISTEEKAQVARLKYVLSNGCKEGLVGSPLEWPGVGFGQALVRDLVLRGVWVDRDGLYEARRRGEDVSEADFAETVELVLSPLPCWVRLSEEGYREAVLGVVGEIESETAAMHRVDGTRPLGARRLLERDRRKRPLRPRQLEWRPCPWVYGRSFEVVASLLEGLKEKVAAYRVASELLRSGFRLARFPENCFPPALPFVSLGSGMALLVPGDPESGVSGSG